MVKDEYLLMILLAASKKAVTWLQYKPPTQTEWWNIVTSVQNMENFVIKSTDIYNTGKIMIMTSWNVYWPPYHLTYISINMTKNG